MPVTLRAGDKSIKGTTVRISRKGFFVRSLRQKFVPGVPVDIEITIADMATFKLRGVVKYSRNSELMPRMNGMGIELTEMDPGYEEFMTVIERERG